MLARYVVRELVRNPRRALAAGVGVVLGVGLFSGVLFFVAGSGASMTKRALAPLALDMQRVLAAPLGAALSFSERRSADGRLARGDRVTVTLLVRNTGGVPANEVVVNGEPPPPLAYVPGSTRVDGRPLGDRAGTSPLAQGPARTGLNVGTLAPRATIRITYEARATAAVAAARALPSLGRISSRESVIPMAPDAGSGLALEQLAARARAIPGVAAADGLSFVDLPPGSLSAGGRVIPRTVRVFGFDGAYQRHYPSIRIVAGALGARSGVLSVEASRALGAGPGATVALRIPGAARPLSLPVGGVSDLSAARPLFYSRKSSSLEEFLYVPDSIVVDPEMFRRAVVPAFRRADAARGVTPKSLPLSELDVLVRRGDLRSDPASALGQTKAVATALRRIDPGQDYVIDNISNSLQVAADDAAVARRMFLFLGLPGALLAAFLTAFAGGVLAAAQRREQANLRLRGANRRHLLGMLAFRTLALAGAGSVAGTALGLASVTAILGPGTLFEASAGSLAVSGALGLGVGMVVTALALYVPRLRSLRREIGQDRGEMATGPAPAWRRLHLDVIVLVAVAAGEVVAVRAGAFDAPPGSVYEGRAASLPSHLLLVPIAAWIAGLLLAVRVFAALASRLPLPPPPRYGSPVWGSLARSLRRRSWSLAGGMVAVGLVVAFGTSLSVFAATYDAAKAADSRFAVGSDLRITPSVLAARRQTADFAAALAAGGVAAATPVVFRPDNAVLTSDFNEDRAGLAALDPAGFARVAPVGAAPPAGGVTLAESLAALGRERRGVLVEERAADDLKIAVGDRVHVLFARGTPTQARVALRVVGLFRRLPGFPEGLTMVADRALYEAVTGIRGVDFFLARSAEPGAAGIARAVIALREGPGRRTPISIDTPRTSLVKDQSSLTALNVRGLVDLDALFTFLMAGAGIGIFVFGLMLQRRREFVTMRAQGMAAGELRALVVGEAAAVTVFGTVAGVLVGLVMGYMLVGVLRPLFVLDPAVRLSPETTVVLAALVLAATAASTLAATSMLRRLRPTEILREG